MRKRFKEWLRQAGVRSELSSAYNSPSQFRRLTVTFEAVILLQHGGLENLPSPNHGLDILDAPLCHTYHVKQHKICLYFRGKSLVCAKNI